MKRLIVTADDFGLMPEINAGIRDAHEQGIVTCASFMANGPACEEAVALARQMPRLEVGLHLGIVEGLALSGKASTITDDEFYFPVSAPCLHRNWQRFIPLYLGGMIDRKELAAEWELQFQRFLGWFPRIPFVNGTQHLHLLPGLQAIVLQLCRKYGVHALRLPMRVSEPLGSHPMRLLPSAVLIACGKTMHRRSLDLRSTNNFLGFPVSGRVTEPYLLARIAQLRTGATELMTHPGFECAPLRARLPGYTVFDWDGERRALMSQTVRAALAQQNVVLTRFSEL